MHNSLLDFYSIIKFLKVSPLNKISVWRHIFGEEEAPKVTKPIVHSVIENMKIKDEKYNMWLLLLSEAFILRRNKSDMHEVDGVVVPIVTIPNKSIEIIYVKLSPLP